MTHGGTLGTPFGGRGIAIAEFDQMQHFIDVCRHVFLRDRHRALTGVLAAHGGGQHRQRLRANGFTQAQVFVVADTERLVVAPQVEIVRPMLNITDGAIPVVHVIHAKTVGDAAAREAHEARLQVGERLDQIGTEMLEPVVGGAWFEGNEIKIDGTFRGEGESQSAFMYNDGIAFTGNRQRNLLLTPIVGIDGDILFCNRISIVVNQSDGDGKCGSFAIAGNTHPCGEIVGFAGTEDHAVPADIFKRSRRLFDFDGRIVRVFFGYRIVGEHVEGCEGAGGHDFAPEAVVAPVGGVGAIVFECAVLYEVGVESAVAGVADVFVEDAPQVGADVTHARLVEGCDEFVGHGVSLDGVGCLLGWMVLRYVRLVAIRRLSGTVSPSVDRRPRSGKRRSSGIWRPYASMHSGVPSE